MSKGRLGSLVRRDVESSIGGLLLFGGAVVTVVGTILPHSPQADTTGYLCMALVLAVCGVVVTVLPERLAKYSAQVAVAIGILSVTASVMLNGERLGGAPMLNEFFYIWPLLYAGFFFGAGLTAAAIGLAVGTYAWALTWMGLTTEALVPRVFLTLWALAGLALAMRMLRRHIDRLVGKLNALARTDVLTGLLNRRAFDERLATELERTSRTGTPFVLVLGDVDHFKALNDRYGHEAGDQALTWVAEALSQDLRVVDTVARVGGEEFALILPETDLAGGVEAAERLRTAVKLRTGAECLTMSFGVVEAPLHGHLADQVLRSADRALYAAKAAGRDRTVTPDGPVALVA